MSLRQPYPLAKVASPQSPPPFQAVRLEYHRFSVSTKLLTGKQENNLSRKPENWIEYLHPDEFSEVFENLHKRTIEGLFHFSTG